MSLVPVGFGSSGDSYTIDDSLRFRSSADAYLSRTQVGSVTDNKKYTISIWYKRGTVGTASQTIIQGMNQLAAAGQIYSWIGFYLNTIWFQDYNGISNAVLQTTALYRDPAAWYHVVANFDSAQATASNRMKLYVNGEQITTLTTANYPALNATSVFDFNGYLQRIGNFYQGATYYSFDGYQTEVNFIDGQALTAEDFGEFDDNGTWKPIEYEGTYGTNGFYLDGTGVTDESGNGNDWTNNNLNLSTSTATTYDLMKDTPSLVDADAGNFCTLNPLDKYSSAVLAEGNLKIGANNNSWTNQARSTFFVDSGKWYWEVTLSPGTGGFWKAGIRDAAAALTATTTTSTGYEYVAFNGNKNAPGVYSSYGSALTAGDVLAFALDMDAGTITAYKNNTSLGTMFSGLSGSYSPTVSMYNSFISFNFGQRPFAYTPPTGFLKLNTFNLPDSTIEKGSDYFNAVLYSGNGGTQSITGVGFQPDWTWIKCRNDAQYHVLQNAVTGAGKTLFTNVTLQETGNAGDFISSFDSDGITVNNTYAGGTNNSVNGSGKTYVSWNWKANGSGVLNEVGDIDSTVSANTTSGFSIVSYTGTGSATTVGHGLSSTPEMIIVKGRNTTAAQAWRVYHNDANASPETGVLNLNTTSAFVTSSTQWNNTAPTSSVFSIGTDPAVNENTKNYIAYSFTSIEGYSAFGKYTGNGSADGPFIYTGFRPAWLLIKQTNGSSFNWNMIDTSRSPYNTADDLLAPNTAGAEAVSGFVDAVSNGFKCRNSSAYVNGSGSTYIYMAFAENPFKNANAR